MANIHWQVVYLRKNERRKAMKYTNHSIKVDFFEHNGRSKQNVNPLAELNQCIFDSANRLVV